MLGWKVGVGSVAGLDCGTRSGWDVKVFGFLNSFSMGGWGMGDGELGNDVYQVVQIVAHHGQLSCFELFVCTCADVFPKSFAGIFPRFLVPFCHGNLVTN